MATNEEPTNRPTNGPSQAQDITAIPEHDKLGPLGTKVSVLGGGGDLRAALLGEFREAIERATRAAGDVPTSATVAIHDYRKALRRARAVLGLVEPVLPKEESRTIRRVLRDARRAVSTARDQAVAPAAIAEMLLTDDERAVAEAALAAARQAAPPPDEIARLLADGSARASAQLGALETALPPQIEWEVVARGLAATYRDARRRLRRAKHSRRAFHGWRRRTKELTHQLELIARHAGPRAEALRDRYTELSDALGGIVDLIMLRELVLAHGAGREADRVDELVEHIEDQIAVAIRHARRAGKPLFERGGRKFARKVTKAGRKDLAPAPVTPTAVA